jgi:hypothetical protein
MHVRSFENEVKSFEAIVAFVLSLLATVAHISNWSGEYREHFKSCLEIQMKAEGFNKTSIENLTPEN